MEEETALLTEDRWVKEGGRLDATDQEMLREASQNGRRHVRVINMREMLEIMQSTEPEKFQGFKKIFEGRAGKRLTFDELVELGRKGNERMQEFNDLVKDMSPAQAWAVRRWRVDQHMTWRRVARAAYVEGWFHRGWGPPESQIMGMAMCKKAALFFTDNFREAPWN